MPPPCCIVTAPSSKARKIPGIESSIVPMTKQLNSVTWRAVPAPAWMRPPGRNLKSCRMPKNRSSQTRGVLGLDRRQRVRDPAPSVGDASSLTVVIDEPVFGLPYVTGNLVCEVVHGFTICHCSLAGGLHPARGQIIPSTIIQCDFSENRREINRAASLVSQVGLRVVARRT